MKGIYLIIQGRADQAFEMRKMQLAETKPTKIALLNLNP
jgi:hypothetical protein